MDKASARDNQGRCSWNRWCPRKYGVISVVVSAFGRVLGLPDPQLDWGHQLLICIDRCILQSPQQQPLLVVDIVSSICIFCNPVRQAAAPLLQFPSAPCRQSPRIPNSVVVYYLRHRYASHPRSHWDLSLNAVAHHGRTLGVQRALAEFSLSYGRHLPREPATRATKKLGGFFVSSFNLGRSRDWLGLGGFANTSP